MALLLALASVALAAAPACPDTGSTLFFKSDEGFQGYRLEGDASYRSLFVGADWEKASPEKSSPLGWAEFWVDRIFAQWGLMPRETFVSAGVKGDLAVLDAYHRHEFGYLQALAREGKVVVADVESLAPIPVKGSDGKTRHFKVWSALLGAEGKVRQFWVATPHPRGAIVLTLIPRAEAAEADVRRLIDSYMANFGPVSAAACVRLREERERPK